MLAADWPQTVAMLGTTVHKVRKLLGWTQEQLAKQAGVSQGLVSRLERGACAAVPFHSVVVVFRTLAAGAAAMELTLSPTATQLLAFLPSLNGAFAAIEPLKPPDPDLAPIARMLQRIPPSRRAEFLAIVRAAAAAFDDADEPAPSAPGD